MIGAMAIGRQLREQLVAAVKEKGSPEREAFLDLGFEIAARILTDPDMREALASLIQASQAPAKKAPTGQADVNKLPRPRNEKGQLVPRVTEPEPVSADQG